ncbi:MAG: DUF547 domain-containing protein [Gammaproteobacteria bacterium]|nr:DUF547 domain-containing protein [Gammaproteobacteria bacterium]
MPLFNQSLSKTLLLAVIAIPLLGLSSLDSLLAPESDLWARWQANDPASRVEVDHSAWGRILKRHLKASVDGINRFDYKGLKRESQPVLDSYLQQLAETPVSNLNSREQQAYWINLYNALTVAVVAEAYPVESIRDIDISPGFFSDGPWGKPLINVEGIAVTLNDIEHRILRPIWGDNRFHYALNCASLGCPSLAVNVYRASQLEAMLEEGARTYINSQRGVDWSGGELEVSSIYAWFLDDFGGDDTGVLAHLKRYAEPGLKKRLANVESIESHKYDWRTNGFQ